MFLIVFGHFRLKINFHFGAIDCHLSTPRKGKKGIKRKIWPYELPCYDLLIESSFLFSRNEIHWCGEV